MEWSEEVIAQLRALWKEGHSTAEIGRRMGITKNAVVGKAHRLQLDSRPSPIRRERRVEPVRLPRRQPGATLRTERPVAIISSVASVDATSMERPRVLRPAVSAGYGRQSPCCWPIGEPGTRSFRFCDDTTLPGKPYCAEHARIAYVRVKDKRDAAA